MRFAFYLPAFRIDDSGFTFEEFLRNLVNAVKISSPDNYPYPLYTHFHAGVEEGAEASVAPMNRSDEMHRQYENYLHKYKVLPEEDALVKFYKKVRVDIDAAHQPGARLSEVSFREYLEDFINFPAFLQCFDLITNYFMHKSAAEVSAAEGLVLIDNCFFERSNEAFEETLAKLRDEYRSTVYAVPLMAFEVRVNPRFRMDRLYCVRFDEERPIQTTSTFYAHFTKQSATEGTAHVEAFLSAEETKKYGSDESGWEVLKGEVKNMFDLRFTLARTEVSLS